MKKLLFLVPGFPLDETQTHVIPFLQHVFPAFSEKYPEIELTIIAIHKPASREPYYWKGIRVIPLNGQDGKYPGKLLFLARSFLKIYRLNRQHDYDGIFNLWYNEFSVFTHFLKPGTFTWMLGQDVKKSNPYLRFFRPDPKKIVALSHFNNEVLFATSGIRAHKVIPMAVNGDLFPQLNAVGRNIDVFGAGWLTPLKNYSLFIDVILILKRQNPDIKAEIAGSGPQENELREYISENGLQENVRLLGLIPHRETLEKMNDSKIFLHTSTFEGGSTVYFEALYSGCQLVGTLEMMDRKIENFHFHTNKEEIAAKIDSLLKNPVPPKRVVYYSMEQVAREIHSLFYGAPKS